MKKIFFLALPASIITLLPSAAAQAVCPVCVVAVGAGLGLSEYLGIDDAIAGLWIGGLLMALVLWTIVWLKKKNWHFLPRPWLAIATAVLYYGLVIWPLWQKDFIGSISNRLWGIDKLILGITVGSLAFGLMSLWYDRSKKRRGHALFPFQKVAMPVGALVLLSLVFYFLTK